MSAAAIAAALNGKREGHNWRCRCPQHGGRSLLVRDGDGGRTLVKCWAGCAGGDVIAKLRRMGLVESYSAERGSISASNIIEARRDDENRRRDYALRIWRDTWRGEGSPAATYLASRRIVLNPWPPSLRFHPHCPQPRDENGNTVTPLPAMVALVECVERGLVGIHCTYLKDDAPVRLRSSGPRPCLDLLVAVLSGLGCRSRDNGSLLPKGSRRRSRSRYRAGCQYGPHYPRLELRNSFCRPTPRTW